MKKLKKNPYKLQRDVLKVFSFEEADNHVAFWIDKSPCERLNAACFIMNIN